MQRTHRWHYRSFCCPITPPPSFFLFLLFGWNGTHLTPPGTRVLVFLRLQMGRYCNVSLFPPQFFSSFFRWDAICDPVFRSETYLTLIIHNGTFCNKQHATCNKQASIFFYKKKLLSCHFYLGSWWVGYDIVWVPTYGVVGGNDGFTFASYCFF